MQKTIVRNWIIGRIYLWFVKLCMLVFTKFTVTGWDNLPDPAEGGLLIVSNHFSIFEVPYLLTKLPSSPDFFATFELLETPLIGPGIKSYSDQIIFINRSVADRKALTEGIKRLKAGRWVTIFPEGSITRESIETAARGESTADLTFYFTRHDPVVLLPARPGSAWMAVQTGVPILPIAFEGTENLEGELKQFKRTEIKMHIGEPIGPFKVPAGVKGAEKKELIDRFGHEMMLALAKLLPEKYRGDYSDDSTSL